MRARGKSKRVANPDVAAGAAVPILRTSCVALFNRVTSTIRAAGSRGIPCVNRRTTPVVKRFVFVREAAPE